MGERFQHSVAAVRPFAAESESGRENGRNLRRTGIIPENQRFGKGRTSAGLPTRTRKWTAGFAGNSIFLTNFEDWDRSQ